MIDTLDDPLRERLVGATLNRLRRGGSPDDLLTELLSRLDRPEAEVILSRALERLGPAHIAPAARAYPMDRADLVLTGLVYLWAVTLFLQNIAILRAAVDAGIRLTDPDFRPYLIAAIFNLISLTSAGAFYSGRSRPAAVGFAAAILIAFPFANMLVNAVSRHPFPPAPTGAVSISALCSFGAVGLIAYLQHRRWRRSRAPDSSAEVFE